MLVRECQAGLEVFVEELVGGVACADDPLAHGQSFRDGRAQHLAPAGVDEHLIRLVDWYGRSLGLDWFGRSLIVGLIGLVVGRWVGLIGLVVGLV